jgi:hypothetical protein
VLGRGALGRTALGRSSATGGDVTTLVGVSASFALSGSGGGARVAGVGSACSFGLQPSQATVSARANAGAARFALQGSRTAGVTDARASQPASFALQPSSAELTEGGNIPGVAAALALQPGSVDTGVFTPTGSRAFAISGNAASPTAVEARTAAAAFAIVRGTANPIILPSGGPARFAIQPSSPDYLLESALDACEIALQGQENIQGAVLDGRRASIAVEGSHLFTWMSVPRLPASFAIQGRTLNRKPLVYVTFFD